MFWRPTPTPLGVTHSGWLELIGKDNPLADSREAAGPWGAEQRAEAADSQAVTSRHCSESGPGA